MACILTISALLPDPPCQGREAARADAQGGDGRQARQDQGCSRAQAGAGGGEAERNAGRRGGGVQVRTRERRCQNLQGGGDDEGGDREPCSSLLSCSLCRWAGTERRGMTGGRTGDERRPAFGVIRLGHTFSEFVLAGRPLSPPMTTYCRGGLRVPNGARSHGWAFACTETALKWQHMIFKRILVDSSFETAALRCSN